MSVRWVTSVVWGLVAASGVYWGFKLFTRALAVPASARVVAPAAWVRGDLSRLFGAEAPPAQPVPAAPLPAESRFQLLGVVSPRPARAAYEGLALIAVDGKPARAYRVGAVVDGENVLQAVGARGATIGPRDGAASFALNLAPPQAAATGALGAGVATPGSVVQTPLRPPDYTPPQTGPRALPMRRPPPPSAAGLVPPPANSDGSMLR